MRRTVVWSELRNKETKDERAIYDHYYRLRGECGHFDNAVSIEGGNPPATFNCWQCDQQVNAVHDVVACLQCERDMPEARLYFSRICVGCAAGVVDKDLHVRLKVVPSDPVPVCWQHGTGIETHMEYAEALGREVLICNLCRPDGIGRSSTSVITRLNGAG